MRLNQRMRIPSPFVVLFGILAACGDWPDVETPGAARGALGDWPVLGSLRNSRPVDTLIDDQSTAAEALNARAANLRLRASLLRTPIKDQAAFDALRARLASQ